MLPGNQHILAAALGSSGDLNPILGICGELRRRGHEVTLITNPAFQRHAEALGVELSPIGTKEEYEASRADPRWWRWPGCVDVAFREVWAPCIQPVYERIANLHRPGKTVLVSNVVAVGARIAREKLGLPLASIYSSPAVLRGFDHPPLFGPFQMMPPWIGPPGKRLVYRIFDWKIDSLLARDLNGFRASLGLSPVKRVLDGWIHSPDRVIGLWPDWFYAPEPCWPAHTALVGFLSYDRADVESPPGNENDELDPARGERPILFTCGSAMAQAGAYFDAAAETCRTLGRPVILVAEGSFSPPREMPPGMTHTRYVPFSRLLPRCSAIVHHGGVGTGFLALAAGIPQVIVPMAFDQFDNAVRFTRLGVARTIPRRRFKARVVASHLREMLESAEVARQCVRWKARMSTGKALQRACELIEAL